MTLNLNNNGSTQVREKTLHSKKLYWVVSTVVVALVLFTLYYSVYVSSQQTYYNERAFRLLSSMGDKFALDVGIARNVLVAAATNESKKKANEYIHRVLHGKIEEQDFEITDWRKVDPKTMPTREGLLTLFLPDSAHTFRIRADYRESSRLGDQKGRKSVQATRPDNPCSGELPDLAVCATLDLTRMVSLAFRDLEEGFFDDVLIADSEGNVLYQQSSGGIRIQNVNALGPSASSSTFGSFFSKASSQSPSSDGAGGASTHGSSLSTLSQSGSERQVDLAGSDYQLFVQPLPISLRQKKQDRTLILCGLRTVKHSHGQVLAVPYTYLIWIVLVVLTLFCLGWPLLKLHYMSSKERLQTRHILYLILSILLATALVTLIALNASYKLTNDEYSRNELRELGDQINSNMNEELGKALATLDALAGDEALLRLAAGADWNQAKFLEKHFDLGKSLSYPYFRYFFLADDEGWQRLKFTVNSEQTPKTNVRGEAYFHFVKDDELSQLRSGGATYKFRMDPLYSPNTGEFLVVLAAPLPDTASRGLPPPKLTVKVLAIRLESVFKPVVPTGYGYAIADPQGRVLFHSTSVRNLNEEFTKEAREDVSVLALISQGSTGSLDVSYLGTQKKMWITPVKGLSDPRLTLIVYKDSDYFTTVNMAIVIVFGALVLVYAILPFFLALVHMIRKEEYPLEAIWPSEELKGHYLHIFVTNLVLGVTFFSRYASFGLTRAFISIFAVALVAALYSFIECRSTRFGWAGDVLVFVLLMALSGFTWALVFPAGVAVYALCRHSLVLKEFFSRWVSLKYAYTLAVVSILVILVVVPACGLFKISYDYVQRLFLQTQQLDLARRLKDRQATIEDYYAHINAAPSFKEKRLEEKLDRYDLLFLNCPPGNPGQSQGRELESNLLERAILDLTAPFPGNALGAKLRELARAEKHLPELTWKYSERADTCAVSVPAQHSLWLTGYGDAIISPYPIWPALDWRVRLCLAVAILALAGWVHFVPTRLFLLDMKGLPPLDIWRRERNDSHYLPHYILLLGHPKSGKRLTVKRIKDVQVADFAEMATSGKWKVPTPCEGVIALNHFEFAIDNADANMHKLGLLEELVYVQHKRIILLSTVDPLYYLTAGSPDIVVPGKNKDLTTAMQVLDRWAAILTPFRKMAIEDITVPRFQHVVQKIQERRPEPSFRQFVGNVKKECNHTAQLRKIGAAILSQSRRKDMLLSREMLIQELLDRADSYYRVLWSTCTQDERLVLYQLAKDGWANPNNELAIQHLQRRKLVTLPPGLRIMNESFRRFVRNSQYAEEVATWEQEGDRSVWRSLKLSLGILAVAAAAWLLYSQQQFFNAVVGYVAAVGAAAGVIFKLLSDLRGGKPSPSAASSSG